jgi:hypothetical protein
LAIGGLNGFVSTEVQNSTSVLRLKFSAKNPAHRQYAARYMLCLDKNTAEKPMQKFILFLPNPFLPTLISTFCIFPNRNPMQKMQKELIFQLFKFI